MVARTAAFQAGMTRAARVTRNVGRAGLKVAANIAKIGAAFAAVAAGGLALMVRSQLKLIDTLAKTADKLGLTTEALQSLRLAGELAGIEVRTMDMAIQRMVRRISEASVGTGEAVKALLELGLNAAELVKLPVEQQLKMIAERMTLLKTQADRVRIAFKLFDSEGVAMVNILGQGAGAIEHAEQLLGRMGLALSRIDAAKVEQVNNAWIELRAILAGIVQRFTVEVAPLLEAAIKGLIMWGSEGQRAGALVTASLEAVAKAISFVGNLIQGIVAGVKILSAVQASGTALALRGILEVAKGIEWVLDQLGVLEAGWTSTFAVMVIAAEQAAAEIRRSAGQAFDDLAADPWGDRVVDFFEKIREAARRAAEEAQKIRDAGRGLEETIMPAVEGIEDIQDAAESIAESIEKAIPDATPRVGEFREVNLRRVALNSPYGSRLEKQATEKSQEIIRKILEDMRKRLEDGVPTQIALD